MHRHTRGRVIGLSVGMPVTLSVCVLAKILAHCKDFSQAIPVCIERNDLGKMFILTLQLGMWKFYSRLTIM